MSIRSMPHTTRKVVALASTIALGIPTLAAPSGASATADPSVLTLSTKYEWSPRFSPDQKAKAHGKGTISVTWTDGKIVKTKLTVIGNLWDLDKDGDGCAYVAFRVAPLRARHNDGKTHWKAGKSFKWCAPGHKSGENKPKRFDFKLRTVLYLDVRICRTAKSGRRPFGCTAWTDITPSPLPRR